MQAVQDFEAALAKNDAALIAAALPIVWAQMVTMELEVPFAQLFAKALANHPLEGEAGKLAFRIEMLSTDYKRFAQAHISSDTEEIFIAALARGQFAGVVAPDSLGRAILPAFTAPVPSAEALVLLNQGRVGEAVLMAIDRVGRGVQGDLSGVTEGLSLLRHIGLEDVARRTALQLMLLERRG